MGRGNTSGLVINVLPSSENNHYRGCDIQGHNSLQNDNGLTEPSSRVSLLQFYRKSPVIDVRFQFCTISPRSDWLSAELETSSESISSVQEHLDSREEHHDIGEVYEPVFEQSQPSGGSSSISKKVPDVEILQGQVASQPSVNNFPIRPSSEHEDRVEGSIFSDFKLNSEKQSPTDQYLKNAFRGAFICTELTCPIKSQHNIGPYFHEGVQGSHYFDGSNPPPYIWDAGSRMAQGRGSVRDEELVTSFRYHHTDAFANRNLSSHRHQ